MATILDTFVGKFVEKLLDLIQETVVRLIGIEEDLQQLHWRLENIKNVLVDAERKRYNDIAIDAWIRQLQDVMYDADDAIDLWRIKVVSDSAASSSSPPSKKVRRFGFSSMFSSFSSPPPRNEISLSIKRINDRLDTIAKNKSEFNLQHIRSEIHISRVNSRQTSELVDTDVVGDDIENATKELVERLVGRNQQQQPCILLAISGMGGIGKTTLAQKIFNESRMQTRFSVKIWVCISQDFNEINLLKQIIRGTSEDTVAAAADTKSELLCLLKKAVSGKEVFLVLDDIWQGQEDVWNELLRNPLKGGASICRILVTTRDENVARKMGAMHIHRVDQLSTAFGWKLLRKSVFVNGEEEDIDGIEDIGIKIVEKCHGLPLAIKAISGVLKTKHPTKKEWKEVLTNNSWSMSELPEELRGALYLSYEDLPSHLKQCFLYLSLYPEDYTYHRDDLVRMWVAEGFVKTGGAWLHEDLAERYYEELFRRNLLHLDPDYYGNDTRCRMHDLLRSLAKYLSEDESFYGNPQVLNVSTSKSKLRRLSIVSTADVVVLLQPTTSYQDSLRTLILLDGPSRLGNVELLNFRFLRVLRLNGEGIQSLPNALHNMVHLRLLDLDLTDISMIPESIGCLTNLQILKLTDCQLLHTLPRGITQLCNLRHLGVDRTPLRYLPKGIGELKQLNDLQGFVVGGETEEGDHGCNLEELGSLAQLRVLSIEKLERASTASFTFASNPHLKVLGMSCTPLDRGSSDHNVPYSEELERLFEQLSPPPCIENLGIENYFGRRFPSWMMSSASILNLFSNLTRMSLEDCVLCPVLPPLGQLPQLKILHISGASSVVTIGPEFLGVVNSNPREGSNILRKPTAFPKLEMLRIDNMRKWEEWSFGKEIDEQAEEPLELIRLLPQLKWLELIDCPKLRVLPKGLSHCCMQNLHIIGAQKLTRIDNLPHLTTWMEVMQCDSMEIVSDLPALKELRITDCPAMVGVESLDSLQRLFLVDASMECLPKWLPTLIQQRASKMMATSQNDDDNFLFELVCNMDALKRCCEGCPDWHIIQMIPRVIAREFNGTARLSYTKQPFSYATNF